MAINPMYGNASMGVQMGKLPPVDPGMGMGMAMPMDQGMEMPPEYHDPAMMDPGMAPPAMGGMGSVTGFPQSAWSQALHQGMAEGLGIRQILASFNPSMYGRYNVGGAPAPAEANPMMADPAMGGMAPAPELPGPSTPWPMSGSAPSLAPPAPAMGGMVPPAMGATGAMPRGRGLMGALGRRGNPAEAERGGGNRRGRRGR